MVLPAPAPDAAPAAPAWLERLSLVLRLAGRGVIVLIDRARPERLGDLVRHLVRERPETEVLIDAVSLATVKEGSTVVLCLRAIDADWLNQERPVVQARSLRLVVFSDEATTLLLARKAVDFYDWISHFIDCPPGPPAFAVRDLRRAVCRRSTAIVWTGGDLEGTFAEALPGRMLTRVTAALPYPELVEAVRPTTREWIAVTNLDAPLREHRIAWAAAEAGRQGRLLLVGSVSAAAALPRVGALTLTLENGSTRLSAVGIAGSARLAAILELSPGAIDDAATLARAGVGEAELSRIALGEADPPRALKLLKRGLEPTTKEPSGTADPSADRRGRFRLPAFPQRIDLARRAGDLEVAAHWAEAWRSTTRSVRSIAALARIRFLQQASGEAQGLLREARAQLDKDTDDDTRFELLRAEGLGNLSTSDHSRAPRVLVEALDLAERIGRDQNEQDELYDLWIQCLLNAGRAKEAALALTRWTKKRATDARISWNPRLARSAASLMRAQGNAPGAASFLEQILAEWPPTSENHPNRAAIEQSLAQAWLEQRRFGEAEHLLRPAIQHLEELGHPSIRLRQDLGRALLGLGQFREAEQEFRRVLEEDLPESTSIDSAGYDLARALSAQGRLDEAEALLEPSLLRMQQNGLTDSAYYARALEEKARIRRKKGDLTGEETILREVLRLQERLRGREHPRVLPTLVDLGQTLIAQDKPREAEPFLRRACRLAEKINDRTGLAMALSSLTEVEARLGFSHARSTARRSLDAWNRLGSQPTPAIRRVLESIAAGVPVFPISPARRR